MQFLEERGEVMEQEKIPNIDDGGNQLEVAEYVDEIYEYYWIAEVISICFQDLIGHFWFQAFSLRNIGLLYILCM